MGTMLRIAAIAAYVGMAGCLRMRALFLSTLGWIAGDSAALVIVVDHYDNHVARKPRASPNGAIDRRGGKFLMLPVGWDGKEGPVIDVMEMRDAWERQRILQ